MCKCVYLWLYAYRTSSDLSRPASRRRCHGRRTSDAHRLARHGPRSLHPLDLCQSHMLLYSVHTPCVYTHDVTFHTYACTQRNARAHAPHQPWCSCDATASGWLWPVHLEHLGGKFHTAADEADEADEAGRQVPHRRHSNRRCMLACRGLYQDSFYQSQVTQQRHRLVTPLL